MSVPGSSVEATSAPVMSKPAPGRRALLQNVISRPALNGEEVFIMEEVLSTQRWRVRTAGGEDIAVKCTNLLVQEKEAWPATPLPSEGCISPEELWRTARAHRRAEAYDARIEELIARIPPSTNAFWVGIQGVSEDKKTTLFRTKIPI